MEDSRSELLARWKRTEEHLVHAHSLLPGIEAAPISDHDEDWYREFLDHNELQLAMEALQRVG